ncbi:hypothetical protein NBRC116591_27410 [Sessilibacter corallicola]|uniref:Uncharacterized protein n=2 Tax=Sessilibacter corallicola TaxID=2904075 RepID=A0ABQ0ABE7_9GAMM
MGDSNMSYESVYLICQQASVSERSPINMDGSEFVVGVAVVPAETRDQALDLLNDYFHRNHMTLMTLESVHKYEDNSAELSDIVTDDVTYAIASARQRGEVMYVCTETSETLNDQ